MIKLSKELRLDAEALASQVFYGHGFLHYGYWPEGTPRQVSLIALGEAQRAYFDKLAETIPANTHSILDVGSGTGSNALELTRLGYRVDCVCPSAKLNAMARGKLPAESRVFESRFEEFDGTEPYDLVMFCESFHYIDAQRALAQAARLARRHVLVFDYFPRVDDGGRVKVSHDRFMKLVRAQGAFDTVSDVDLTANITPTFDVLDAIKNEHVRPFAARLTDELRRDHPLLSRLLGWPLRAALARLQRPSNRRVTFPATFEYRLLLLSRR